ncbi:hypothetical protein GCM10022204_05450 [Microlunatus aurantiacus]|uniref:Choice-of-anchor D domain-containing protein n=1 Tax=Microlunatus aurantiacus TaxID=446786 RepID=A0ABP7CLF9_9ACTN
MSPGTRGLSVGLVRRLVTTGAALLAVAVVAVGGGLIPPQTAPFRASQLPLVGRTTTVCTTSPATDATATVSAVAVRKAPGREGVLTGVPVGTTAPLLTVDRQGFGDQQTAPATPVVLTGQGVMATAGSGMITSRATKGDQSGLMAAPCVTPATEQWFVGVGATPAYRTDLVLTNPDAGQAEVDLRFYGRNGLVVVPGSPGLVVDPGSSRTVSLDTLVTVEGPLTVSVRASTGRVSAVALDRRSVDFGPTGADWQLSAVAPTRSLVVPGVPEGAGTRTLVVANPGMERASVGVQVLGVDGAFAPAGAEQLEVPPESTAEISVAAGLAGAAAGLQLTSDQPVTAAVVSEAIGTDALPDLAVQSATAPIVRTGVVPLVQLDKTEAELVLSNGGDTDVPLSFEVYGYDGVKIDDDDVLLVPHATATRRLDAGEPAYLVVTVPAEASVVGGVTFLASSGGIAGVATVPVLSPDVASRAPQAEFDPTVGR